MSGGGAEACCSPSSSSSPGMGRRKGSSSVAAAAKGGARGPVATAVVGVATALADDEDDGGGGRRRVVLTSLSSIWLMPINQCGACGGVFCGRGGVRLIDRSICVRFRICVAVFHRRRRGGVPHGPQSHRSITQKSELRKNKAHRSSAFSLSFLLFSVGSINQKVSISIQRAYVISHRSSQPFPAIDTLRQGAALFLSSPLPAPIQINQSRHTHPHHASSGRPASLPSPRRPPGVAFIIINQQNT